MNMYVALLVVIILIIVTVSYYAKKRFAWNVEPSTNMVSSQVSVKTGSKDGNIDYLGTATDVEGCQALAAVGPYVAYTWHDSTKGAYANQCFGLRKVVSRVTPSVGHYSGTRNTTWW